MRKIISIAVCMLACSMVFAASFSSVEGKLFNDKSFIFPDDLLEEKPVIIALTLSSIKVTQQRQGHFHGGLGVTHSGDPLLQVLV